MLAIYWICAAKKSFFAAEQERDDVKVKRADFISSISDIDPKDIIVLDESGADLGMASNYARAEGGGREKAPKPHNVGNRFYIIGRLELPAYSLHHMFNLLSTRKFLRLL